MKILIFKKKKAPSLGSARLNYQLFFDGIVLEVQTVFEFLVDSVPHRAPAAQYSHFNFHYYYM